MKFNKKFFLILALIALVASMLPTAAFAAGIKTKGFAQVDKYSILSTQPLTLQFKGHLACDRVDIAGSVIGKNIYVSIKDVKMMGTGRPCDDSRSKSYLKELSLGTLVPGTYTVYINPDGNKWDKKFKVLAPMLPTATPAASPVKP